VLRLILRLLLINPPSKNLHGVLVYLIGNFYKLCCNYLYNISSN
jgi:hypothetical protein